MTVRSTVKSRRPGHNSANQAVQPTTKTNWQQPSIGGAEQQRKISDREVIRTAVWLGWSPQSRIWLIEMVLGIKKICRSSTTCRDYRFTFSLLSMNIYSNLNSNTIGPSSLGLGQRISPNEGNGSFRVQRFCVLMSHYNPS